MVNEEDYPKGYEDIIKKDPNLVLEYTRWIIRDRWPEAESYIIKDPEYIYLYTKNVIGNK